jgi:hypothetical protein
MDGVERRGVYEPHAAIDPADPRRAAIVAVYPSERIPKGLARNMWCWRTEDSGVTWRGTRVPQGKYDGEGVADPLVSYGADGALITVAMNLPGDAIDRHKSASAGITRKTVPSIDELLKTALTDPERPGERRFMAEVAISRSEDHGATWSSTVIENSRRADKTAMALGRRADGHRSGNVYVAWMDVVDGQVAFSRSLDGGRSAERARRLGGRNGLTMVQVAVGPRGRVHLVWHLSMWARPDMEDAEAATAIFHACSDDGGATFSSPRVIARHDALDPDGRLDRMGVLSLASGPRGDLVAAWSEAVSPAIERGEQVRNRVRWIHSEDGETWSEPRYLSLDDGRVSQGLPAVAATDAAWHVLVYEADEESTRVQIHSARSGGTEFKPSATIARRAIASNDIFLQGNYHLNRVSDIANVGHYIGLAGAGRNLVAGIVLPETDDWRSRNAAYAGFLQETPD